MSKDKLSRNVPGENDHSLTKSQDLGKRLHPDPSQLMTSEQTGCFDDPENVDGSMKYQNVVQKGNFSDPLELSVSSSTYSSQGSYILPLLPTLNTPDDGSSVSIVLGRTACRGGNGPPVGAVDIGVGRSAYYFRIALPGVKKDPEGRDAILFEFFPNMPTWKSCATETVNPSGEFSCEIEHDGKVHVRGVTTTGGQNISRYSRVYEMKFQQQCPPGPFTLSFCLPGPVDPRLFSPNFRSDGIFEAVVMKYE